MTPYAAGDRWTLYHADYRETLARAAEMGGADLVFTSPPYCDARTYGAGVSWTDADYAALGDAVFAALRPGGHALINVDARVKEWRPGFGTERGFHPWRLMLDWAERVGFRVPDRLAFGRDGLPGSFWGFRNDWEPLLWFVKPGAEPFAPVHTALLATSINAQRFPNWRAAEVGTRCRDGSVRNSQRNGILADAATRRRGSLWVYGPVGGINGQCGAPDIARENHPARWPYKLAEDIVRCFCPPGGLACDPFVGAGTSAAAALAHGRRFVGGDLLSRVADPSRGLDAVPWVEVARRVIDARTRQQRLFSAAS